MRENATAEYDDAAIARVFDTSPANHHYFSILPLPTTIKKRHARGREKM
jgi:hypothetical protein